MTASADATYLAPNSLTVGSVTGATLLFGALGTGSPLIAPTSMTINGTATVNITNCPLSLASYPLIANYPYPNLSKLVLFSTRRPVWTIGVVGWNGSITN